MAHPPLIRPCGATFPQKGKALGPYFIFPTYTKYEYK